ncbi:Gp19/Gp15/Gp42 family protein [Rhodococcus sp. BH5]|uniref:Gp19/Gp15/Gp42 family protein n=1 Tax=Rhodococcus sp. BH5 TaxID=2871702 RepID=UPI003FA779C3
MGYATVSDLESRWRPLESAEAVTASALLEDAAVMIRAACPDVDVRIDAGLLDPSVPVIVSCRMVKRAMSAPDGFEGVSGFNQSAGPFSQNLSFANPAGDMWLGKPDRKLLGCSTQRAFMVDLLPPVVEELP